MQFVNDSRLINRFFWMCVGFWMSDKPLIQQALANDLGALVMEMPAANAIPFLKNFWKVHCQEWHGLDRIRLDIYKNKKFDRCSVQNLLTKFWNVDSINIIYFYVVSSTSLSNFWLESLGILFILKPILICWLKDLWGKKKKKKSG